MYTLKKSYITREKQVFYIFEQKYNFKKVLQNYTYIYFKEVLYSKAKLYSYIF